jgi:hypothetical protein
MLRVRRLVLHHRKATRILLETTKSMRTHTHTNRVPQSLFFARVSRGIMTPCVSFVPVLARNAVRRPRPRPGRACTTVVISGPGAATPGNEARRGSIPDRLQGEPGAERHGGKGVRRGGGGFPRGRRTGERTEAGGRGVEGWLIVLSCVERASPRRRRSSGGGGRRGVRSPRDRHVDNRGSSDLAPEGAGGLGDTVRA